MELEPSADGHSGVRRPAPFRVRANVPRRRHTPDPLPLPRFTVGTPVTEEIRPPHNTRVVSFVGYDGFPRYLPVCSCCERFVFQAGPIGCWVHDTPFPSEANEGALRHTKFFGAGDGTCTPWRGQAGECRRPSSPETLAA